MLEICFARIPLLKDGEFETLLEDQDAFTFKDGVLFLSRGVKKERTNVFATFNIAACAYLSKKTKGAFAKLCGGCVNGAFVKLQPRRAQVEKIRAALPTLDENVRGSVRDLLEGADRCLRRFGSDAAIVLL